MRSENNNEEVGKKEADGPPSAWIKFAFDKKLIDELTDVRHTMQKPGISAGLTN